ncbi:MAG: hypothetical protein A2144_06950 [Chloroflexi bacterium RBG_16_50_9]|nr:MAG: hypothetical protein A2144_06950 [Chloroflexi bacterium RBG_16_50_9]
MAFDWIIRIVLFGVVHWILAGILLQDLASREKIFGGRKWIWAIVIIFVIGFGSLLYLLFHPEILNPDRSRKDHDRRNRR